jgi:hypothetical protein
MEKPTHDQKYFYLFDGQGFMPLRIPKLLFSVAVPPAPTFTFNASLNATKPVFPVETLGANGEVGIFSIAASSTLDRMGVNISSPITREPVGLEKETRGNASISNPRGGEGDICSGRLGTEQAFEGPFPRS